MTATAGHLHLGAPHFRLGAPRLRLRAPHLDTATIVLAAVGVLLVAALVIGGRPQSETVTGPEARGSVQVTAPTTRAVASTTTTAAALAAPTAAPVSPAVTPAPAAAATAPAATAAPLAPPPAFSTGCADALSYLVAHEAPGFVSTCAPGSALGHYGYTCANVAGRCPGVRFIRVACPAPFVYMNEAHNSWTLIGQGSGIDPYGQGNSAEQAQCNGFR